MILIGAGMFGNMNPVMVRMTLLRDIMTLTRGIDMLVQFRWKWRSVSQSMFLTCLSLNSSRIAALLIYMLGWNFLYSSSKDVFTIYAVSLYWRTRVYANVWPLSSKNQTFQTKLGTVLAVYWDAFQIIRRSWSIFIPFRARHACFQLLLSTSRILSIVSDPLFLFPMHIVLHEPAWSSFRSNLLNLRLKL